MSVWEIVFWLCAGLLVYAQVGYPLLLAALARVRRGRAAAPAADGRAADGEPDRRRLRRGGRDRREGRQRAARSTTRATLEIVVACDGSTDGTGSRRARAGADVVLDLAARRQDPRAGRGRSRERRGDVVAFSDANAHVGARRAARARRRLRRPGRRLRLRAGRVRQRRRHEPGGPVLALRDGAARAASRGSARSPRGNGAIYATRREAYVEVDPIMGHDLSFPFNMVKRGWRAVYVPAARATEKMVPSIEGEFARKRRMMSHAWPIVAARRAARRRAATRRSTR